MTNHNVNQNSDLAQNKAKTAKEFAGMDGVTEPSREPRTSEEVKEARLNNVKDVKKEEDDEDGAEFGADDEEEDTASDEGNEDTGSKHRGDMNPDELI